VSYIDAWAFTRCYELETVVIPNGVKSIEENAFFASGLTSVEIGGGLEYIGEKAFHCGLESINVSEDNLVFSSVDGVLFNKTKDALLLYPHGKKGPYTIPDNVASIEADAFDGCYSLTSVTIPNSVKSIGSGAFNQCDSLKTVVNLSPVPQDITLATFKDIPEEACLYVPDDNFDAYGATAWWMKFKCVKPISEMPKTSRNSDPIVRKGAPKQ